MITIWPRTGQQQELHYMVALTHTHTNTPMYVYPVLHVDNSRGSSSRTAHKVACLFRAGYMWYTTFYGAQLYWAIEYQQKEGKRGKEMEIRG